MMRSNFRNLCRAFTLIELAIVVLIVGILAAVSVPAYSEYVYRAKLAEGYVLIDSINKGQTTFYLEHKFFLNLITDINGRNAAMGGGNKYPLTSIDTDWNILGSFLQTGDSTYFHFVTAAGSWDASGTQETEIHEDSSGKLYPQSDELGVNDKACANNISDAVLGISVTPNLKIVTTSATASFKGSPDQIESLNCTILFQTLFGEGNKVSKTGVVTILE